MFARLNKSSFGKTLMAGAFAGALAVAGTASRAATQEVKAKLETDPIPAPCHPNKHAQSDMAQVAQRDDVRRVPKPLKDTLVRLAGRPHTFPPLQIFAEADQPSMMFQYYLLDTHGFEPNVFTAIFPGSTIR